MGYSDLKGSDTGLFGTKGFFVKPFMHATDSIHVSVESKGVIHAIMKLGGNIRNERTIFEVVWLSGGTQ